MKTDTVYLGIDVSKKSLHLAATTKMIKEFPNTNQGIQKLLECIQTHRPVLVVMEASGGYERIACDAMQDAGIAVCVAQPGCVRHFAKSIKVLAKTDEIDAQVIARFAEAIKPQATEKTPENVRKFRALHDRRQQIILRDSNKKSMSDVSATLKR